MKPKIKSDQTTAGTRRSPRWFITALLLLLCPLMLPLDSPAANNLLIRKINLKVGDVLNYQIDETYFSTNDTVKFSSWFTFKVIGKNDTLYSMIAIPRKKIQSSKNMYRDSRFPESFEIMAYMSEENFKTIPFYLSESGVVQPIVTPDFTIKQLIRKRYPNDLFGAKIMMENLKTLQKKMRTDFQQFFVGWRATISGRTTSTLEHNITYTNVLDLSPDKDFSKFVTEFETLPADTINGPIDPSGSKGKSRVTIDPNSSLITEMESSTTMKWYKIKNPQVEVKNKVKSFSVRIQRFIPDNDSTVTITGTIDKNCNPKTFTNLNLTNTVEIDNQFVLKEKIEPGKSFKLVAPLKWPIVTDLIIGNLKIYNSLLLEPGDSIHMTITPSGVEYSGRGALKCKLAMAIQNNELNNDTSLPEVQTKQKVDSWISTEQKKIEPFRGQLSGWAYNQLRCDIYYSGMFSLVPYYYNKNRGKISETSFETLFGSVEWDNYHSYSSVYMMRLLHRYLNIKTLLLRGATTNGPVSETEIYHLAKLTFKNEIRYHALSQCVYEELKRKDLEDARNLFYDYEKAYKETGFYPFLKNKLENRVELGNGATTPDFEATDVNGEKVSLGKMKGKYVQLLFVDLKSEGDTLDLKAYQKLKEDLLEDKFEMITVFINKDESLTKAYINRNHPKGILVSNPDWQLDQLKRFNSEYTSPYYLVNPKGIIVFSGAGSPTDYFVNMFIEMINNDTYNKAEASISKSTLYWVLSLSAGAIVLTLVVVWLVTRAIKRREAMRREQLEMKLGAVRSQLNPHFLFNAMSSIQFLVNHDEKEKANLFLSKFAQLMRKVLLQSETERVPLNDELENIKTYLELEALRHRFQYRVAVDEGIDLFNTEIPVMLLQPFVENAVIHGIAGMEERGEIDIRVTKPDESRIQIRITDNGQGYEDTASVEPGSNGKGMQITRKRAELMMEKYGHEILFEVMNRKETDGNLTGTAVTITIETEK